MPEKIHEIGLLIDVVYVTQCPKHLTLCILKDLKASRRQKKNHVEPMEAAPDTDRLLRENDKLKKSLEKEKFFNKLLDQEIQELKSSIPNGQGSYASDYWSGRRRVSKGAFYTLLLITLVMAAYIGYGIYYDKKFDYLNLSKNIPGTKIVEPIPVVPAAATATTPANSATNSNEQTKTTEKTTEAASAPPPAVVKDSVPNIIGSKKSSYTSETKSCCINYS